MSDIISLIIFGLQRLTFIGCGTGMAMQRVQYLQGHFDVDAVLLDELGDGREHSAIGLQAHR